MARGGGVLPCTSRCAPVELELQSFSSVLLRTVLLAGSLVALVLLVLPLAERRGPAADLRIANGPDPRTLDPAQASAIADGRILAALFEGLYVSDPVTAAPRPGLASGPPIIEEEGRRWRIPLRGGLRWSDGVAYDAEDLAWSFRRFLAPETGARMVDLLATVVGATAYNRGEGAEDAVGIRATSPTELVFELTEPTPWLDDALAAFPLLPVPRHVVTRHGATWARPGTHVGNGPFRLESHRLRDRVRVVRNEHFHAADEVSLARIDFLCVEAPGTMLNLFLAGEADIITEVPPAAVPRLLERFGQGEHPLFRPTPRLGTFLYRVNTRRPPFQHPAARRALSLAIDREQIGRAHV